MTAPPEPATRWLARHVPGGCDAHLLLADIAAGIEAAAALRPRPAVIVVLTDRVHAVAGPTTRGRRVIVGLLASTASRPGGTRRPGPAPS